MDVVYSIDDNFIPQAAALTASVLENNAASGADHRSGRFRFHILSNGISVENQEKFRAFARGLGAEAFFYDLGDFEERLEKILGAKPETGRFVKAALGRIFAASYLPEDVERFLYLDADMIARKDISPLFDLDLSGHILAAVAEPTIYENLVVEQDLPETGLSAGKTSPEKGTGRAYFNTGLLLVDRRAWDREKITEKCLLWYTEHNGKFDFADQDIINHALAGRIVPLSQRWNFQTNYHYQSYASLVKRSPWYGSFITKGDYEASAKDPVIVHYAGDERPWIRGNRNPYKEDFWSCLDRTPWKGLSETEGRENYMRFYHAVNVLSEKLPGFRTAVSKIYYRTRVKRKR